VAGTAFEADHLHSRLAEFGSEDRADGANADDDDFGFLYYHSLTPAH